MNRDQPAKALVEFPMSQGSVHLDALRGAAALLVFLNHTRALYFTSFLVTAGAGVAALPILGAGHAENDGELKVASAAVVIFFVLSGYLVGGSVLRALSLKRWSWPDYLVKRLSRLLTVLVPAVVLGAALDQLGRHIFGAGSVYNNPRGMDLVVAGDLAARLRPAVLLGNFAFLQTILVPIEGTNVSLWSLANEFWYYLAFPLMVIPFFAHFSRLTRAFSLLGAALILWFVGYKIAILFPIWIMGSAVRKLPNRLTDKQGTVGGVLALATLIGSVLFMRKNHFHSIQSYYVIGILSAVLLYTFVPLTKPAKSSLYRTVSGFFSKISYSLYLFHLPLAVFLCASTNSPWHPHEKTARNLFLFALSDLFVMLLVYLLWRLFEANTDSIRAFFYRNKSQRAT